MGHRDLFQRKVLPTNILNYNFSMDSPGVPQGPIPAYSHGYKHNYSFSMDSPGGPQGPIPAYSPAYKHN